MNKQKTPGTYTSLRFEVVEDLDPTISLPSISILDIFNTLNHIFVWKKVLFIHLDLKSDPTWFPLRTLYGSSTNPTTFRWQTDTDNWGIMFNQLSVRYFIGDLLIRHLGKVSLLPSTHKVGEKTWWRSTTPDIDINLWINFGGETRY